MISAADIQARAEISASCVGQIQHQDTKTQRHRPSTTFRIIPIPLCPGVLVVKTERHGPSSRPGADISRRPPPGSTAFVRVPTPVPTGSAERPRGPRARLASFPLGEGDRVDTDLGGELSPPEPCSDTRGFEVGRETGRRGRQWVVQSMIAVSNQRSAFSLSPFRLTAEA